MACTFRLDVKKIEESLRAVQADFSRINESLDDRREPMQEQIVSNMVAGYEYVNFLLAKDINVVRREGLHHFLELNHIVLCGPAGEARRDYREHIEATTSRFYQQEEFSISHLRRWAEKHENDSPWKLAAGLYILHISWPQLFLEGNHRTGALMMSCILARQGKPPFVLSVENAKAYFDPSSLAKKTRKDILGIYYTLPKIKKRFARFLERQACTEYLLSGGERKKTTCDSSS